MRRRQRVGNLTGSDRSVCHERKVYSRVGDEVRLELGEVDVDGAVEAQRRGDRGDDLADEAVQVRVGRPLDVEVPTTDVVDRFVVDDEGAV